MRANVAALRAAANQTMLGRYADIGRTLTGRRDADEPAAVDAGIEFAAALAADLKVPPLGSCGLTEADVGELASQARRSSSMKNNPVELSAEALARAILEAM
jgi:alcohol dehydrogenase class IV